MIYFRIIFAQYLENELTESDQVFFCTSTLTSSSLVSINHHFSQSFDGVTALDLLQSFVSAQYLENKLTKSNQNL